MAADWLEGRFRIHARGAVAVPLQTSMYRYIFSLIFLFLHGGHSPIMLRHDPPGHT